MSVNSICQSAGQMIPSPERVVWKCYGTLSNIVRNLNKIAVPTIMLVALSNISEVDTGPVSYGVCVSACLALANPVLTPACIVSCLAF